MVGGEGACTGRSVRQGVAVADCIGRVRWQWTASVGYGDGVRWGALAGVCGGILWRTWTTAVVDCNGSMW